MEDIANDIDNSSDSFHDKTTTFIPLTPLRTPKAISTSDLTYSDDTSRHDLTRDGNMYVAIAALTLQN